jgi:hypothetical protein
MRIGCDPLSNLSRQSPAAPMTLHSESDEDSRFSTQPNRSWNSWVTLNMDEYLRDGFQASRSQRLGRERNQWDDDTMQRSYIKSSRSTLAYVTSTTSEHNAPTFQVLSSSGNTTEQSVTLNNLMESDADPAPATAASITPDERSSLAGILSRVFMISDERLV